MHGYHDTHGRLPPAVVYGADGKPLYSWRVLILPYIEQQELYKDFKLHESWDSPHNLRLLPRMPRTFNPFKKEASSPTDSTYYRVFVGKGTAFEDVKAHPLKALTAGPSRPFLVVEAGEPVPWTKPDELPYAPDLPVPPLGGISKEGFRVALGDGSVMNFK